MLPLLWLIACIVIAGVVLWGMEQMPMDPTLKQVARVVIIVFVVIFAVLMLLQLATGVGLHWPGWR